MQKAWTETDRHTSSLSAYQQALGLTLPSLVSVYGGLDSTNTLASQANPPVTQTGHSARGGTGRHSEHLGCYQVLHFTSYKRSL